MKKKKVKKVFRQGAIPAAFIGESIAKHQTKTDIGSHHLFLGQVRADEIEGQTVRAIEYTAYEPMAEKLLYEIRETAFEKFDIICMHIHHSLGLVGVGEICFFVFVSSAHRAASEAAVHYIVEQIKTNVPIFGKEILANEAYQWKVNR